MILFGVDFNCQVVQAVVAVLVVGFLTVISLLKFYAYVTCGYFHDRVKMNGKTVIITGANGGIGKETAREIAKRGARVIMACRNTDSGNKARDLLKRSAPSRIVVVASELYRLASVNLNNISPTNSWCTAYLYYVSKYANIYFTLELARRLEGTRVTANCLHPGMIDSGIWRNVPFPLNWPLKLIIKGFFKTPVQGCQTSVFLACSEEVEGVTGKYYMDCAEKGLSSGAKDESKAKKLWELSEKYVHLRTTDPKI
ncbi:hypothetical protein NQ314_004784 [Rhamnusium bicolor]|uniref:Retinol dehydrogenase 14 n=1 Tax=Rhamnusium bicolor TaxID=1586634 RepID=A0AAV8ZID8_9CUCU|nr:hypothetical protein NQ314_004784 [Rhamnusium bicolor]